jgi:hypothetical protein
VDQAVSFCSILIHTAVVYFFVLINMTNQSINHTFLFTSAGRGSWPGYGDRAALQGVSRLRQGRLAPTGAQRPQTQGRHGRQRRGGGQPGRGTG